VPSWWNESKRDGTARAADEWPGGGEGGRGMAWLARGRMKSPRMIIRLTYVP
jgi:hypothetical protein